MKIDKLIKRVCLAVVGAGSSLVIAACYGVHTEWDMYQPENNRKVVSGRVINGEMQGVDGMEVCANVPGYGAECTYTSSGGYYEVNAEPHLRDHADANGFWVVVKDVDGPVNGHYEDEAIPVDPGSVPAQVDIQVEEVFD